MIKDVGARLVTVSQVRFRTITMDSQTITGRHTLAISDQKAETVRASLTPGGAAMRSCKVMESPSSRDDDIRTIKSLQQQQDN